MSLVRPKLKAFLEKEGLTSEQLEAASRINRRSMTKYKRGGNIRLTSMIRIQCGACLLTGRQVAMTELWDLNPPEELCNKLAALAAANEHY